MNKTGLKLVCLFVALGAFLSPSFHWGSSALAASTYSFTNTPGRGSHPGTLELTRGEISVDLSGIPRGTKIHRAVLVPHRKGNSFHYTWEGAEAKEIRLESTDQRGDFLTLRGPDYLTFDATASVQGAVDAGKKRVSWNLVNFPFLGSPGKSEYLDEKTGKPVIRLDMTADLPPLSDIPTVRRIQVRHRDGSTLIHWEDPAPLSSSNTLSSEEFSSLQAQDENPHEIRYRVYRHEQPITPASIGAAELVGETDALSVWDWRYFSHGIEFKERSKGQTLPRYPIDDGVLADHDMGLFVFSPRQAAGSVYYAITRVIDGAEDLERLVAGENATAQGIAESPGPGAVLLREEKKVDGWHYVKGITTLQYYVKWEAPPNFSIPQPFDYLVAIPEDAAKVKQSPLSVALHEWGGSLNRGWLWSYNLNRYGALHVSTNQFPYDWWTGFHENLWTLKPLTSAAGAVQPFTQRRIRSFLDDFVVPKWNIDTERVLLHGGSMGGAGASLWGIKAGDYFANLTSGVGVHIPAETPQFKSSFTGVYGKPEYSIKYANSEMAVWDYEDNTRWLRDHVKTETPHISFSNGKNDGDIGWPQAWKFARALIETKRPFTFKWGMRGHGERPHHMGDDIDFSLHQSLPAFSAGTLDDDLGSTPEGGGEKGQLNYYYLWETASIEDKADFWGITVFLRDTASAPSAEVHMTPRRLQHFSPRPGVTYQWTNTQNGKVTQEGTVTADSNGLITLRSVVITKKRNRIALSPSKQGADVFAPARVSDLEVSSRSQDSLTLGWTSPGDDGDKGTAASFEIRVSSSPITVENWKDARIVSSAPLPLKAGSRQSIVVSDLDFNQNYHFAMLAVDDAGNPSELSNTVQASTSEGNVEVFVANVSELYEALARLRSYTTLLLEDGIYDLSKTISIGSPWTLTDKPLKNIIISGKSGDASRVTLKGPGMDRNQDPKILVRVRHSRDFILQNLTVQGAYYHLVQIHGEDDADGVHLNNVRLLDAGQQLVKVSRDANIARYADEGVVENSLIAFTDYARYSPDVIGGAYYTNGVDVLGGSDWIIRNNLFKNIRAPHDRSHPAGLAGSAILMWKHTKNATVINNVFTECDTGITFGLTAGDDPDHEGGLIANNCIYREGPGDVGISLNKSRDVRVESNTVFLNGTFPWTIEDRRYRQGANVRPTLITNNVTDGPIKVRDFGYAIMSDNVLQPVRETQSPCRELQGPSL